MFFVTAIYEWAKRYNKKRCRNLKNSKSSNVVVKYNLWNAESIRWQPKTSWLAEMQKHIHRHHIVTRTIISCIIIQPHRIFVHVCVFMDLLWTENRRAQKQSTRTYTHTYRHAYTYVCICKYMQSVVANVERHSKYRLFFFFLYQNGTIAICLDAMDKSFYTFTVYSIFCLQDERLDI